MRFTDNGDSTSGFRAGYASPIPPEVFRMQASDMTTNSPYSIRLTVQQRAFIKEQSQAAKMSESDWIRTVLFTDAALVTPKQKSAVKRASDRDISQVIYLLGQSRIPNNLNQIAKGINMGTLIVTPDTERHLDEAYRMVLWIRQTLIHQLGLKA